MFTEVLIYLFIYLLLKQRKSIAIKIVIFFILSYYCFVDVPSHQNQTEANVG